MNVQSTVCYLICALEEGGEEVGGDVLGASLLELSPFGDAEQGLPDGGVLREDAAEHAELMNAPRKGPYFLGNIRNVYPFAKL